MSDERTRAHQRRADVGDTAAAAAVLRARMRASELTQAHVELAANLGHPAACRVCPEVEVVKDSAWGGTEVKVDMVRRAAGLLGVTLIARIAADWGERGLREWEPAHPGDERPRRAIVAARAWADCPCEEHQVKDQASDAHDATDTEEHTDASAAAFAGWAAAYAADDDLLEEALATAAHTAEAIIDADSDAERKWQRLRLAAYVLGEIEGE